MRTHKRKHSDYSDNKSREKRFKDSNYRKRKIRSPSDEFPDKKVRLNKTEDSNTISNQEHPHLVERPPIIEEPPPELPSMQEINNSQGFCPNYLLSRQSSFFKELHFSRLSLHPNHNNKLPPANPYSTHTKPFYIQPILKDYVPFSNK